MMQAGPLTITNPNVGQLNVSSVTGKLSTLMARVFGCWHAELSRPFSRDGKAYRSCVNCGAQREFNLGNWEMEGNFYYGKASTKHFHTLSAVRRIAI